MVANRQRPTWREEEHIVEKIKRTLLDPGIVNVARLDRDLIFQLNKDPELDNEVWYVCVKRAAAEWKLRKDYLGGNEASTDSSQPVNKALRPRSSAAKSQPPSVASPTVKTDCADRTVGRAYNIFQVQPSRLLNIFPGQKTTLIVTQHGRPLRRDIPVN